LAVFVDRAAWRAPQAYRRNQSPPPYVASLSFSLIYSQADTTGPQAFLSQAFLRYVCCPPAPVPASRRVVATAGSVKAGMTTAARGIRIVSVSIVLFLVTGQVPRVTVDPFRRCADRALR
jgi:hypothetical protein